MTRPAAPRAKRASLAARYSRAVEVLAVIASGRYDGRLDREPYLVGPRTQRAIARKALAEIEGEAKCER